MMEVRWGIRRALGVRPKNKGFKNPFEIKPNPLQKQQKPTQNQGAQSKSGFVPFD
jgi:hypothetical protein